VGYKVNSERAVQFRKWATRVIKPFTIKAWSRPSSPSQGVRTRAERPGG
jgi:hypothetical protein